MYVSGKNKNSLIKFGQNPHPFPKYDKRDPKS
jgi:hypothetical protein